MRAVADERASIRTSAGILIEVGSRWRDTDSRNVRIRWSQDCELLAFGVGDDGRERALMRVSGGRCWRLIGPAGPARMELLTPRQ